MSVQAEFTAIAPPLQRGEVGGIRIGQSRVTLDSLLASYHTGSIPEEIAIQYPVLRLEDIYATITYYLAHREQLDHYIEEHRQQAEQQRQRLTQEYNWQI